MEMLATYSPRVIKSLAIFCLNQPSFTSFSATSSAISLSIILHYLNPLESLHHSRFWFIFGQLFRIVLLTLRESTLNLKGAYFLLNHRHITA